MSLTNLDYGVSIDSIDSIWQQFESAKSEIESHANPTIETLSVIRCKQCESDRVEEGICHDCGLINEVIVEYNSSSHFTYDNEVQHNVTPFNSANARLNKLQKWYMWSNEEKNVYKLKTYIKDLCAKLQICEGLIVPIINTVVIVMDIIKKNDGTKRARVKDGIILACIHYVSKNTSTPYSYIQLSKKMSLDIKYVTKAEKLILELINSNKLHIDKMTVLENKKAYDYVVEIVNKKNLKVSGDILEKTELLINICEDNDILLDHTPLSIGVACFYYILKAKNIDIDLKIFSKLYDLSVVTVIKTYNKIKVYDAKIATFLAT